MPKLIIVLVVPLLLLASCRRSPQLIDQFDPADLEFSTCLRADVAMAAPAVVVGVLKSVRIVGRSRPSARAAHARVLPVKLSIEAENVLRGDVGSGSLEFYFFAYADRGSAPMDFVPGLGERYIWFLKRDRGVLRTVGDVTSFYMLRVVSGSHRKTTFLSGTPLGQQISQILLVPGERMDVESFAGNMGFGFSVAEGLTSGSYAEALLRRLLSEEHLEVRAAACEFLATRQFERDVCSPRLARKADERRTRELQSGCPNLR